MNINTFPAGQVPLPLTIHPDLLSNPSGGTHFSHGGIGGYIEVPSLQDMYDIPSFTGPEVVINYDGLTSGRRKLGMIVHVLENGKYYQLKPKYKGTKKIIPWHVLFLIPDNFRGLLMNASAVKFVSPVNASWSDIAALVNNGISEDDFSSLKEYAYYADQSDPFSIVDEVLMGIGDLTNDPPLNVFGNIPDPSDDWTEIEVLDPNKGVISRDSKVNNITTITAQDYADLTESQKDPKTLYIITD
jgi:hypothetical protein